MIIFQIFIILCLIVSSLLAFCILFLTKYPVKRYMALGLIVSSLLMLFLLFDKDNRTVEGEYRITNIYSVESLGNIEIVKLHSLFEEDDITLHIPSRQLYDSDLDITPGDVIYFGGVQLRARGIINSEYRFESILFGFDRIEQVGKNNVSHDMN